MDDENKNKILLTIEYNVIPRILIILFRLMAIALGLLALKGDILFIDIMGFGLLSFGVMGFIKNIFFINMKFYDAYIETEWNVFGRTFTKRVLYDTVVASKGNMSFGGSISLLSKKRGIERFKSMFYFSIDTLGVNRENIEKIKIILIEKNVLKGDELGW